MAKNTSRTAVGANIVTLRKKLNYNQKTMAELIGVTRDCFAKYETTVIPPVDKLIAIAKIFNVSVDELVGSENKYQPGKPVSEPIFETVNPYINNIERKALNDNGVELTEVEYDLLLKFREMSDEKRLEILRIFDEI